ncbi:Hint domain-containing protein [Roseovarius bejariae]|nr:Hint domain-containing protein [Roseovarius bejariae]
MITTVSKYDPPVENTNDRNQWRKNPPRGRGRAVTCFTPGTAITTLSGKRLVEDLKQGDRILTRDRGFQPLLWAGRRELSVASVVHDEGLCPVRIKAGTLGPSLPDRDLVVSPGHRFLTTEKTLVDSIGESECLIQACDLLGKPGIDKAPAKTITYIHLLFDQHELILSDNAWSESYHLGESTNGCQVQPLARKCVGRRVLN